MKKLFKSPIGIGVAVFVVALAFGFALKSSGFHIQKFTIVRGGDIAIASPQVAHRIFLDQRNITPDVENATSVTLAENIEPGIHSVLIYNDTHWPWKKDIVVRSGETTSITPFLISKNASGVIVTPTDESYDDLRDQVIQDVLPSESFPRASKSGRTFIWVENNNVHARWTGSTSTLPGYYCDDDDLCDQETIVLESAQPIRNLDFYKDHEEILLVAFSNGVFALEIDKRGGTQNFQPIYKGAEQPRFVKTDTNTIIVADGSALFVIDL